MYKILYPWNLFNSYMTSVPWGVPHWQKLYVCISCQFCFTEMGRYTPRHGHLRSSYHILACILSSCFLFINLSFKIFLILSSSLQNNLWMVCEGWIDGWIYLSLQGLTSIVTQMFSWKIHSNVLFKENDWIHGSLLKSKLPVYSIIFWSNWYLWDYNQNTQIQNSNTGCYFEK